EPAPAAELPERRCRRPGARRRRRRERIVVLLEQALPARHLLLALLERHLELAGALSEQRERLRVAHARDGHRITLMSSSRIWLATFIDSADAWKARW